MSRGRVALPVGAALLAVVAGIAVLLAQASPRSAYENGQAIVRGAVVPGGESFCQGGEFVPAGASSVTLWASTAHRLGSPLELRAYGPHGLVTEGRGAGGYVDGPVTIPVRRVGADVSGATVCVENRGPIQAAFMGDAPRGNGLPAGTLAPQLAPDAARVARAGAKPPAAAEPPTASEPPIAARIDWHLPGNRSWLSFAPVLARRAALAKPGFAGPWTFWVALALALAAAGAAVAAALREVRRSETARIGEARRT